MTELNRIDCEHLVDASCQVATALADGITCHATAGNCRACLASENPRGRNVSTVGLARVTRKKAGQTWNHLRTEPEPIHSPNTQHLAGGPGTHLHRAIPKLFRTSGCGCAAYAKKMDRWGIAGCEDRFETIVEYLVTKAKKHQIAGLFGEMPARVGASACVRTAIRRARWATQNAAAVNGRWFVAVTTAPRPQSTLFECVNSIRSAGWEPTVFAEPGSPETDAATIRNPERMGVWHNWLASCRYALEHSDAELILTVQDDGWFHYDSRRFTESILWPAADAGFVSLYTPKHYTFRPRSKTEQRPVGVNRIWTKSMWGACALVWDRRVLERTINHRIAKEWPGAPPGKRKDESRQAFRERRARLLDKRRANPWMIANSDTVIGKLMNATKRTMWFVDPSPVQHIATTSAIGHGDNKGRRNCIRCARRSVPLDRQVPRPSRRYEIE